jgi:hypothetical protein
MMDVADLEPIRWAMIEADEVHRLKKRQSAAQVFGWAFVCESAVSCSNSSAEFSGGAMGIAAPLEARPV